MEYSLLFKVIALLGLAVISVALFRRMHLPPILAFLFAGLLSGPEVLGLFSHPEQMHLIADIGIVFLLFSLGLEFSLPKLVAMRSLVFGVGTLQMVATTAIFSLIAWLLGFSIAASVIIAGMLALSSTAIVIKQISEMGVINQKRSQMAISVLLFQDLAVVPFLIVIPLLAIEESNIGITLLEALGKGVLVVALLMSIGKWLLPRLFREVARTRTDELFVMCTLLVALLAAGVTYSVGLSMALGAFLAGMMLGESQYRYQLEADIRPFRDILMGLFFTTVGMQLDIHLLASQGHWVIIAVIGTMVVKVLLVRLAAMVVRADSGDAWAAGLKVCQVGEFSFVIAALAASNQIISSQAASFLIAIGIISMAFTPWLVNHSQQFAEKLTKRPLPGNNEQANVPDDIKNHIIIAGFGRVGQTVARLLRIEKVPFIVIDSDPTRVQESRYAGEPVIFGDASSADILKEAGVSHAKLVLVTFDSTAHAKQVISSCKRLNPTMQVMIRTKRDYSMDALYEAGAFQVVPELQEGSLMLVTQVLHSAGVPMSRILKRVRAERKGRYDHMHGFYPGETTEITYDTQDKLEFIHAIVLHKDAWANGKTLGALNISRRRVTLKGLRRMGTEFSDPDDTTQLVAGDVIVIAGKPRRVERAERYILEGD
ncbi:monovalent cation:proton antiporter family protein [Alteromonas sediminis]|uniref:monovalent cation:proton antiporter family protein n=1 Tax=Alteromonas sediminis TaxID=2259342 RepID=UPI001F0C2049|nr:monovalent cation:proton antiporter family protein [Alteromonas sediminis]